MLGVEHARVDEVGRLVVASNHEDFSGLASTRCRLHSLVKKKEHRTHMQNKRQLSTTAITPGSNVTHMYNTSVVLEWKKTSNEI